MRHRVPCFNLHISLVLFLISYLGVQYTKYMDYPAFPFIHNHLNDILVIPIVATICLHTIWILKKDYSIRLGVFSLVSLAILYSFFFELYLPDHNSRYTGDLWDVICYFTGAVMFYILQKLP